MAVAPFKVCIPSCGKCIGIAAHSYEHLREVLRTRYKIRGDFCLQQEDGTLVCDEDYFQLLEPHTKLTVVDSDGTVSEGAHSYNESAGIGMGEKRFSVVEADSSSLLPAGKRPRLESTSHSVPSPQDHPYVHNMMGTLHHRPQQMTCQLPQPPQLLSPPQCRPGSLSSRSPLQTSPPHPLPSCGISTTNAVSPSQLVSNPSPSSLVSRLQIANVMSLSDPTQRHVPTSTVTQPLLPPLTQPQQHYTSLPRQIHPGLPAWTSVHPGSAATRLVPASAPLPRVMYVPSQPPQLVSPREQQNYRLIPLQHLSHQAPQLPSSSPWPQPPPSTAQHYAGIRGPYTVQSMAQIPPTLHQMCAIPNSTQHYPISGCNTQSLQGLPSSGLQTLRQKLPTLTKDMRTQSQQILLPSTSQRPPTYPCGSAFRPRSQSVPTATPSTVLSAGPIPAEPSPPKKVLEVKVVQCIDTVTEGGSEDEDEEGDRLCIVEHTSPSSPDLEKALESQPSPMEQSTCTAPVLPKRKTKPPDLLLHPPKPISMSEQGMITEDEMECGAGQPSPDEGYSSSPSPHDLTRDFTSQLPFESYETPQTTEPPSDKQPDGVGEGEGEGDEIVDVVTVDEGKVDSDAAIGGADDVSLWRKNTIDEESESKEKGEDSGVDLGAFSSHVQTMLEDDSLWEEPEVLESGSIIDISSEDEVFSRTTETSDLGRELIVSVPFVHLPRKAPRRRTSSTSSQSSSRSEVSLRTRQRRRRKRRKGSRASEVEELVVKIPLRHIDDVTYLGLLSGSQSEGTEDSDGLSTIEFVAASVPQPKPKRVPQIIHLEPHFDLASPPPCPLPSPRWAVEPEVEVADYSSEVIVPTGSVLCCQHDLDSCLSELLDTVQQMRHSNGIAGSEGVGLVCLDVGDEVELEAAEDAGACEVTGMDLLNLGDHAEVEMCAADESDSNSYCKDVCDEPYTWKVQTLAKNSTCCINDPRKEVQRYSLGPNTCFQLCRSHGEWKLESV